MADKLVAECPVVVDRPKGSAHPRYPEFTYPLDYGYLEGTSSGDGAGIDIWIGSASGTSVVAVAVTIDILKRDSEVKLLVACTDDEIEVMRRWHDAEHQAAMLARRSTLTLGLSPADAGEGS